MQLWQILLVITLILVFIPTYMLMRTVERLKAQGDSTELQKKQKQLNWCIRLLVVVFLITLGVTLFQHYAGILETL